MLALCGLLRSQADTSVIVATIEISEQRLRNLNVGNPSLVIERKNINVSDVSTLLSTDFGVYVKNYGPGSLATSSIRGGSASHTLLLWNDLPLQNPYLGLLDLSLLNTWSVDHISFDKGGNSAMWGSGAIGSVINLQQKNTSSGKFSFENLMTLGSFGRFQEKVRSSVSHGRFRIVSSYEFLTSENDFPFQISSGETKYQSNAKQEQQSFNQDIYFTPNSRSELVFHFWYNKADRQIPPVTTQRKSEAFQKDKAYRFSTQAKYILDRYKMNLKLAFFDEDLDYYDPLNLLESRTKFRSFISDFDIELRKVGKQQYNIGISFLNNRVFSVDNYDIDPGEYRLALFGRYFFEHHKVDFQVSGRQEIVSGRMIPFMPSFELKYTPIEDIDIRSKLGRNYRLPTLNDRFWSPGGNPDLLAESGWSQELSINWKEDKTTQGFSASLSVYNRVIDNWIQWGIGENSNLWTAYNLNKVWSRGIEPRLLYQIINENVRATIKLGYDITKSTNQIANKLPKIEVGSQLLYTPKHSLFTQASVFHQSFAFTYSHRHMGSTQGVNGRIEAFQVADLQATWKPKFKTRHFELIARVNNCWNANYRIIERRPMPGRNYEISIRFYHKKA